MIKKFAHESEVLKADINVNIFIKILKRLVYLKTFF